MPMGVHVTERVPGDMARMQELTFKLCAPFSCSLLLVLVVGAALTSAVKFTLNVTSAVRFFCGATCKFSVL